MPDLPSADSSGPAARDDAPSLTVTPPRGTVLVVDDEPMVVRAVAMILARSGYGVTTAEGPSDAVARFDEAAGCFDLLLTDVVMPDGGGRRLAERLRERMPALRVLFMSGFTDHESVRDDRELAGPLLMKPFSASKLEAAVRDALDAR